MREACFDTVILSDIHLGSETCRASDVQAMLKSIAFNRLVLLGDIFNDLNFSRLKKEHWNLLSYIRKLSNPKRNVEVVWVEGNHDQGLTDVMSHLVGVEVYQEYTWDYRGKRYLAVHGHQFDRFMINNLLLSGIGVFIYTQVQRLHFCEQKLARFLDRMSTSWLRLSDVVSAGALNLARHRGADVVFCGHTHEATQRQDDGVQYYNTGCWTNSQATYLTVSEEGVQVHEYQPGDKTIDSSNDSGSSETPKTTTPVFSDSLLAAAYASM